MLDLIRNLVASFFGKILLAIMVLSFALWGVGDILSSGNSQLAAKIGNEKITLDEFYSEFQNSVKNYNQNQSTNLTLKEAYDMQLHDLLLQELIYSKMVDDYAKNRNLYLSDESLKTIITSLPEFQNSNKEFSNTKYKNFIFNNFPNEEVFLKELESTVFKGLVYENFNINNFMSQEIVDIFYNYEGEKRSISYFLLNEEQVDFEINKLLISEYYENNKSDYLIPEKTIVDVIEININDFKNLENIDINNAKYYYEQNINQYTKKETRSIQFLRFINEEDAYEFYEIASKYNNEDLDNYMTNNNLTFSLIENFTGETFSEDINNKIFNLEENTFSDPMNYNEIGYYLFRVTKINEKEITEFNLVKNEIINFLALELAYQEFDDAINITDEMLINDYSFNEIAQSQANSKIKNNVELETIKEKFGDGYLSQGYDMPIGFTSDIIIKDNAAFIFNIKDKQKSYIPDLTNIIGIVEKDFIEYQKEINSIKLMENILEELSLQNNISFKEYASNKNYNLQKFEKIKRNNDQLSEQTNEDAFAQSPMKPFKIITSDGLVGLGIITDIFSPGSQISSEFYKSVKNNINNNFTFSLSELLGSEIIEKSSYEIYNQNIDKLFM